MRAGETGFDEYKLKGVSKYIGYTPIDGSNGWSLCVYAPVGDFLGNVYTSIIILLVIMLVILIVAVFVAIMLGKTIGNPVKQCTERIEKLAKGDLTSPTAHRCFLRAQCSSHPQ